MMVTNKTLQDLTEHTIRPKDLRRINYTRGLQNIRAKLSGLDRLESKLIHRSNVDRVSAGLAHTLFRPLAILMGGLCALIGSIYLFYTSHQYGFSYNYLVVVVLFLVGLLLGLLIDLLVGPFKKKL